ncbi:hypothetical protein HKD37_07G019409 [Glycine soja]
MGFPLPAVTYLAENLSGLKNSIRPPLRRFRYPLLQGKGWGFLLIGQGSKDSKTRDGLLVTDLVLCLPLALDLVAYWLAMGRKQRSNLFVDELR